MILNFMMLLHISPSFGTHNENELCPVKIEHYEMSIMKCCRSNIFIGNHSN